MRIKLWGVRGSIPTPLSSNEVEYKIKQALSLAKPGDISSEEAVNDFVKTLPFSVRSTFGGNTTSIEVNTDTGDLIIVDCGTGLVPLGRELLMTGFNKGRGFATIFITHTHWDHISGIPFFTPFYIQGNRFNIYSPFEDIKQRLVDQQRKTHFPISLDYMSAAKEFYSLEPDSEFYLNDTIITNKRMPHPGGAFGYRIENNGKVFVYTADCEFNIDSIDNIAEFSNFFMNADVCVFDTQYTFEESIDKFDWGHSNTSIAIDIAGKFNIKKLILFHHDPTYDDTKLANVYDKANMYLDLNAKKVSDLEIEMAYDGMEILL